jgi:hypothetical protein
MKILFILMLLAFGVGAKAESASREELFSPQENSRIFNAIDYICGDIWCEGYYEYKFISLKCDKKSNDCDLSFSFLESVDDQKVNISPVQVCHIEGINGLDDVIQESNLLKFEFIDKLSECFNQKADDYRLN